MRSFNLFLLTVMAGCSEYEMVHQGEEVDLQSEEDESGFDVETASTARCTYHKDALIRVEVTPLEQGTWTPGWNQVVEFTLVSDKDTCYAEAFSFFINSTDRGATGWNACDDANDRLYLSTLVDVDANGIETWRDAGVSFWSNWSETENGLYTECRNGHTLGAAFPYFNRSETPLHANQPLTFRLMMYGEGNTDPSDGMSVDMQSLGVAWEDVQLENVLYPGKYYYFKE